MTCSGHTQRVLTALATTAAVLLAGAPATMALLTSAAKGGPATVATATLSAPTGAAATFTGCIFGPEIEVTWNAPAGSPAPTFTVERATSSGGPYTVLAKLPATARSYEDAGALKRSATYWYRVTATYHSWSAAAAAVSAKTRCG